MYFRSMKALLVKKIQFKEKKKVFKDSIEIFQGLIEFIKGLIARKLIFEVNLSFNWEKVMFRG